jgi:O-acetyl-ADP-ribose deacetylase (regulator of RNase III)
MVSIVKGNIFESQSQTIVNTVNCLGFMGKGLALEYKARFPDMFISYKKVCNSKLFSIGKLQLYKDKEKWILNFPTKYHYKNPSKMEYIETGLKKFVEIYKDKGITSIAFPQLGCSNGGLDWKDVEPLMVKYLDNLDIPVEIYIFE